MFNKNGKINMMKNIWQQSKQIWTHCFFVASYNVVSYYRFLYTDPGNVEAAIKTWRQKPALLNRRNKSPEMLILKMFIFAMVIV
jgi:hypothetical protein